MCTALDVAQYVINWFNINDKEITNLKLQKILYFIQGEAYRKTKNNLFDDDFEAWRYGPVVRSVYYEFCKFVASQIQLDESTELFPFNQNQKNIIESVCNKYQDYTARSLVSETHEKDAPWDVVFQDGNGMDKVIPKFLIEKYFTQF